MKITAFLLVLVLLLGLLAGCHSSTATQPTETQPEETGTYLGFWDEGISSKVGIELLYLLAESELEDADVTFHINVNCGEFYGDKTLEKYKENPDDYFGTMKSTFLGDDFTIENGETVSWRAFRNIDNWKETLQSDGGVFAEAVIFADGHVVGYRLIEFYDHSNGSYLCAQEWAYKYYPKVDGVYPSITEESVRQEMQAIKQTVINKNRENQS